MGLDFLIRFLSDGRQVGVEVGKVKANLSSLANQVSATKNSINGKLNDVLGGKVAGLVGIGAITELSRRTLDFAGRMSDLSDKTGISTDALQSWDYAAKQSGSSVQEITEAFKKMQLAQVAALGGNKTDLADFGELGVSLADLKSKNPEQLFLSIADNLGKSAGSARQLAAVTNVLGRSADNLLPAFRDGFADSAAAAKDLGQVMGPETIAQLDAVGDSITRLAGHLMTTLAPALGWVAKQARTTFDFLRIAIGGPASFFGALAGGASFKEASNAVGQNARDVIDARIQDDKAVTDKAKQLQGRKRGKTTNLPADMGVASEVTKSNTAAPTVDSLARIGLFVGPRSNAVVDINRQQLQELRRMVAELRDQTRTLKEGLT